VFQIECDDLFRQPVSSTFHGRDVFAPIAAHLSKGLLSELVGREIFDFVRLELPEPFVIPEGRRIVGSILHIDHYGNCITNLTERELPLTQLAVGNSQSPKLLFAGQQVTQFGSHFEAATDKTSLFAYTGSAGFWEIALWCDSAAKKFAVKRGTEIILVF
jgi:S-adenosylmethionine hydrolase